MKENDNYTTKSEALTTVNVALCNTARMRSHLSQEERMRNWFIEPLKKLGGDDSIICLMIIMPILEKIIRHKLRIDPRKKMTIKGNNRVKTELAEILLIPNSERDNAALFWDCFRNGLMHRAMVKTKEPYILYPHQDLDADRVVYVDNNRTIHVHVWKLRDKVIHLLESHGKALWEDDAHQLPDVW